MSDDGRREAQCSWEGQCGRGTPWRVTRIGNSSCSHEEWSPNESDWGKESFQSMYSSCSDSQELRSQCDWKARGPVRGMDRSDCSSDWYIRKSKRNDRNPCATRSKASWEAPCSLDLVAQESSSHCCWRRLSMDRRRSTSGCPVLVLGQWDADVKSSQFRIGMIDRNHAKCPTRCEVQPVATWFRTRRRENVVDWSSAVRRCSRGSVRSMRMFCQRGRTVQRSTTNTCASISSGDYWSQANRNSRDTVINGYVAFI